MSRNLPKVTNELNSASWVRRGGGGRGGGVNLAMNKHLILGEHDTLGIFLVFSVTPFKIDRNKNQNRAVDKAQNLGKERS